MDAVPYLVTWLCNYSVHKCILVWILSWKPLEGDGLQAKKLGQWSQGALNLRAHSCHTPAPRKFDLFISQLNELSKTRHRGYTWFIIGTDRHQDLVLFIYRQPTQNSCSRSYPNGWTLLSYTVLMKIAQQYVNMISIDSQQDVTSMILDTELVTPFWIWADIQNTTGDR